MSSDELEPKVVSRRSFIKGAAVGAHASAGPGRVVAQTEVVDESLTQRGHDVSPRKEG